MGRKRWKQKGQAGPTITPDFDPITRSIAVHGDLVAVAAGRLWRVVDVRSGALAHEDTSHEGPVRGLAFSPDGRYLATCADDKTTRVWATSDWSCLQQFKSGKKATCCTFTADGGHVIFADRFGDVLCAPTTSPTGAAAAEASLLLGHLQSIVTSLSCSGSSSGQQLVVSTDKDGKVRASVLPADPTKGSYEIQSYCLGHTKFVTSAAAVPQPAAAAAAGQPQRHLLLSGAGDGTVRLWDVDTGKELCCYVASEQPPPVPFLQQQKQQNGGFRSGADASGSDAGGGGGGGGSSSDEDGDGDGDGGDGDGDGACSDGQQRQQQEQEGQQQDPAAAAAAAGGGGDAAAAGQQEQEPLVGDASIKHHGGKVLKAREACCAVLSLAVAPDGSTAAAAVEGQQEVQLLSLDGDAGQLVLLQKLALPDVANPAAVAFDQAGRLWVAGGVLVESTESAHIGVAAKASGAAEFEPVTGAVLPEAARAALEHRVPAEEEQQQEQQQQQQGGYYFESFKKAVYILEEGATQHKRVRRDAKDIERLRALAAAQDQQQQEQQQQQQQKEASEAGQQGA